jgi:hypothetical protein
VETIETDSISNKCVEKGRLMSERVSVESYPDYDKKERKRIKYLITMYHYLTSLASYSGRKRQLIEALGWCLEELRVEPIGARSEISAEHLQALVDRHDWYQSLPSKNGFQLQEMGALRWLIEEFGNVHKPCRGVNTNICVAEGCYAQACLRLVGVK